MFEKKDLHKCQLFVYKKHLAYFSATILPNVFKDFFALLFGRYGRFVYLAKSTSEVGL